MTITGVTTNTLLSLIVREGPITQEEYENIVEPDKGWRIRCPTEWGGHGDNFNEFFCTNCKKEFCLFDEKGKQRGTIIGGQFTSYTILFPSMIDLNPLNVNTKSVNIVYDVSGRVQSSSQMKHYVFKRGSKNTIALVDSRLKIPISFW